MDSYTKCFCVPPDEAVRGEVPPDEVVKGGFDKRMLVEGF